MWKKIRYVLYFLLFIVIFSITYKYRECYYVPFIQSNINKFIDSKLSLRNFSIELPLTISLYNLEYNNEVFINKATLRFEPLELLKNIKNPLKSLVAFNIDSLNFIQQEKNNTNTDISKKNIITNNLKKINSYLKNNSSRIFINKSNIIYSGKLVKLFDTEIYSQNNLSILTTVNFKKHDIYLDGSIESLKDLIIFSFQGNIYGNIESSFGCTGDYNTINKNVKFLIDTENLYVKKLKFGKSKIRLKKVNKKISVNFDGNFGNSFFETQDSTLSIWKSTGTIKLTDINETISSTINYDINKNEKLYITAKANDITFLDNKFGNLEIESTKDDSKFELDCNYDSGIKLIAKAKNNGMYVIDHYKGNKKIGSINGNYKEGEISVNIKNIPIKNFMFLSKLNKNVKGLVSLNGTITSSSGTIKLYAKNLSSSKLKKFDAYGELTKKDSQWFCRVSTKDKKLNINSFYETKQNNGIEFFFSSLDPNNILKILGYKKPQIYGSATGYIGYNSKNSNTIIDINLKDGSLYNNKFKSWTVCGDISQDKISISTFSFVGTNSSINLNTLLDFNNNSSQSYINCDIKDFKIDNVNINSQINFLGTISENKKEISGVLNINKLLLNDFNLQNSSNITLSNKQIRIRNINNENNISGELLYNFKTGKISAKLKAVQSKLSKYYSKIKGRLDLDFSMDGSIKRPKIKADCKISNGLYNNMTFDVKSKINTKNNKTYLDNLTILFDKNNSSSFKASGKLGLRNNDVKINIKNFTHKNINRFVGFITPFKGTFNGTGQIIGALNKLSCTLDIYSNEILVKNLKFNNLNSKINLTKDSISIKDSTIKLNDSEIKIIDGKFNIKSYNYSLILKLVNTHFGLFDIFGTINLNGKMIKKLNGSIYTGNIVLDHFWLNRQQIDNLLLDYAINNRKFIFETDKKEKLSLRGAINFNNFPNILLEKINISQDDQCFNVDGKISKKCIDIKANAKSVSANIITDSFNLPFDMNGNINIDLLANGNISSPKIDFAANSTNGSIFNVSYTKFNINTVSTNNILSIKQFDIEKDGEYKAKITGSTPFWLDSKISKQMLDKKININYELVDNKCGILKEYSEEKISAKSGKINLKGTLTGTIKNMINTGELVASISNITTNSYINKIKNLTVDLEWKNNFIEIKKFSAKVGSGIIDILGNIRLSGIYPKVYDLSISTGKKGIPITIKELPIPTSGLLKIEGTQVFTNFSKAVPTFDFKLYGNTNDLKLVGWAKLENAKFCFPSPIESKENSDFTINDIFPNLFINIDLLSANSTIFENDFANVYLNGKINLKGNIDDIKANGIVETSSGRLSYMGNDFDVLNSKVEIINNDIFITGEAESDVYSDGDSNAETIKVFVDRSNINDLKVRFASKNDPTMDSKTALARLTKTDPSKSSNIDTSTDFLVKQQAIRLLGSNIAMPLANTVLKKTGIVDNVRLGYVNQDVLQVSKDTEPTLAELLYGMKYSVEKNVNRLLQIGYSLTFDQVEREIDLKHALEMSFKLNKDLFLKGSYGLKSDNPNYEPEKKVMLEQRLRFGGKKRD